MQKALGSQQLAAMVGQRIRELREERSWTTRDLAAILKLPVEKIESYEAGRRLPRVHTLVRLAEIFGISVAGIVEASESPASEERLSALLRRLRSLGSESDRQAFLDLLEAVAESAMLLFQGRAGKGEDGS